MKKRVRKTTEIELYEISCVSVGMNPGALAKLKEKFSWDENSEKEIPQNIREYLDGKFKELQDSFIEQIEDLKILLISDPDGLADSLLGKGSESPAPAEEIKAEQINDGQIEEAFQGLNKDKN